MGVGGAVLRSLATFLYALEFCCAGIVLGVYSYFLSVLADRDIPIARDWKAVEGISGIAVVYTIFAVLLTCCLGGARFFAFLAIVLDVCFTGAFIALAVLTRRGSDSCTGFVTTPIGFGPSNGQGSFGQNGFGSGSGENVTYAANYGLACRLNKAAFAVSIIGAFLFAISAGVQVWVSRHHQKEKKYGPSPANNYTAGSGNRKFWQRKPKNAGLSKDAELGPVGTGVTGTTFGNDASATDKYEAAPANGTAAYHTAPTGTGTATSAHGYNTTAPVGTATTNPYGYNNSTATNY